MWGGTIKPQIHHSKAQRGKNTCVRSIRRSPFSNRKLIASFLFHSKIKSRWLAGSPHVKMFLRVPKSWAMDTVRWSWKAETAIWWPVILLNSVASAPSQSFLGGSPPGDLHIFYQESIEPLMLARQVRYTHLINSRKVDTTFFAKVGLIKQCFCLHASKSPGKLVETQKTGSHPSQSFWSGLGLGWGLRLCFSSKFPGDAADLVSYHPGSRRLY